MNNIVLTRTRGNIPESTHRGHICVINNYKEIIAYYGNPHYYTFFRSSAKPIQTIEVFLSGAYKKYDFTDEEIALMCASHYGEENHISVLNNILQKIQSNESDLLCGKTTSYKYTYALELARNQKSFSQSYNDCSGKHAGMLAVCKTLNYPTDNYLADSHPLQEKILEIMSIMSEYPKSKISLGIDGCSVPVFAMPLYNMALAYLNFINPINLTHEYKSSVSKIYAALTKNPLMIAGSNSFCSSINQETNGRIIGKLGAEAVYCIAVKDPILALSFKIEDGNKEILPSVIMETLLQLDLLKNHEYQRLKTFYKPLITNTSGKLTGEFQHNFKLIKNIKES